MAASCAVAGLGWTVPSLCGCGLGRPSTSMGVVKVGWDEETCLEVFPSLLWMRVVGGLTTRGIT